MTRGIRFSTTAIDGLDTVFYCWCRVKSLVENIEEYFKSCKPQDFWLFTNEERRYTEFISSYVKPTGYITVSLRSKELFRWGVFEIRSKLPKISSGPILWFGFELDDLFGGGVLHFMWNCDRGVLAAFAGGFNSRVEMDLTRYLPIDASTHHHLYKIVYREGIALWYIDDRLRAIAILGCGGYRDSAILYNKKPYTIGFTRDTPSAALPVLLDIDGGDVDRAFEWPDLHPWDLRVSEGDPKIPVYLDLFIENTDTLLRGYGMDGGDEVVSTPFPNTPNWRELLFAVDGRGTLTIENFAGGQWFEYRTLEVSEKKLYSIPIQNRSIMSRVVFRSTTQTRIIEAQAVLL